jgi:hypothetical protein
MRNAEMNDLKLRTKQFTLRVIRLVEALPTGRRFMRHDRKTAAKSGNFGRSQLQSSVSSEIKCRFYF